MEWRSFDLNAVPGGVLLRGRLDAAGGALLRSAIDVLAKRQGPEDTRRATRRRADAVLELANHALDTGTLPMQAGQRPHLQVTTTLETLLGAVGAPAGALHFSEPISFATVQRLACDSSITRILLDAKSSVIDVGRAKRAPSAAMRRALQARDGGCVWPGCDRPPSWTAAHHFTHWARGGPTALHNLGSLCWRHHENCNEGGWTLAWSADGRLLVIPPPPDWPAPHGERAPTATDEARELARRENDERLVRAVIDVRVAAQAPPSEVPI